MLKTGMVLVVDEDYAAFYLNGELQVEGPDYYVEDYVFRLLGVEVRSSENVVNPLTNSAWPTITELDMVEAHDREGD
jgi:hypothetical protein